MFIKVTRTGSRSYAQLVESFRDEQGRPRQRTLATLGRIDEAGGQVDALLTSLLRVKGRPAGLASPPQVQFASALALGDVWALHQLWHELGFDRLHAVFRRARYTTPVEQAIRVMVFNRLCDADSKLGALRWLQTVALPGVDAQDITHQHLLRSMDALMDHQAAVDDCVAQLLRPLIDERSPKQSRHSCETKVVTPLLTTTTGGPKPSNGAGFQGLRSKCVTSHLTSMQRSKFVTASLTV